MKKSVRRDLAHSYRLPVEFQLGKKSSLPLFLERSIIFIRRAPAFCHIWKFDINCLLDSERARAGPDQISCSNELPASACIKNVDLTRVKRWSRNNSRHFCSRAEQICRNERRQSRSLLQLKIYWGCSRPELIWRHRLTTIHYKNELGQKHHCWIFQSERQQTVIFLWFQPFRKVY